MPTAACGINCDACRLNLLGVCSTCGSGISQEALKKIDAQQRVLGAPCPILSCAVENRVEYCSRDCDRFPCHEFREGPYPFSQGYLDMQERRRRESHTPKTPSGNMVKVPTQYWEELAQSDAEKLCENALAKNYPPRGILLPFSKEYLLVDTENRCLCRQSRDDWDRIDHPLLELLCLLYLLNVGPELPGQDMVSVKELKTAHFFKGPHELQTWPLLERYGNDLDGFKRAAENLEGEVLDLADAAYKFLAFPKVPVYYLLWRGDEEFKPRLSVLFDRSIEHHLAADAIWGLVNLVTDFLMAGDKRSLPSENIETIEI